MEHHSNVVSWQLLCKRSGPRLRVATIDDVDELRLEEFARLLGARTRIVAETQLSNALGSITPVEQLIRLARAQGAVMRVAALRKAPDRSRHQRPKTATIDTCGHLISHQVQLLKSWRYGRKNCRNCALRIAESPL